MKKTLSFILAALMLSASLTACNTEPAKETEKTNETKVVETNVPETAASESDAAETNTADIAYATDKVTENGAALAHIVVLDGADQLEQFAAEEMQYHIKLVSGAEISVTNTVKEDSLPIIICTPDTLPELETMFPEDLAWLRDTGVLGTNEIWAEDGFAIRTYEGKIYIFGAVAKGALNGVYDFIEENMGILWTRADETVGTVYEEQPTITISKTDYKEKSPFSIRGWHTSGNGNYNTNVTEIMMSRNKMSTSTKFDKENIGLTRYVVAHDVKAQIVLSPLYDPNEDEYWCTDITGKHLDYNSSPQINYYSDKAVEAVAAYILEYYKGDHIKFAAVGMEDTDWGMVYPEDSEPFEYEPGKFVEAGAIDRNSTVFFTFVNKVARIVKESRPDLTVTAFSYSFATYPPACDIDDNVWITFCTYAENVASLTTEPWGDRAVKEFASLEKWGGKTNNLAFYTYYGCHTSIGAYNRPIWDRLQSDAQYYAEHGYRGIQPEGYPDDGSYLSYLWEGAQVSSGLSAFTNSDAWDMNALTNWIYGKLLWNPYEDVDALIVEFCDKSYGAASEYMQEYYRLLRLGWEDGTYIMSTEFNNVPHFITTPSVWWDYCINIELDGVNLYEAMCTALQNAWDAANDVQKERIRHIKYVWENYEEIQQYCPRFESEA